MSEATYDLSPIHRITLYGMIQTQHKEGDFLTLNLVRTIGKKLMPSAEVQEKVAIQTKQVDGGMQMSWNDSANKELTEKISFTKKEDTLITALFEKLNSEKKIPNDALVLDLYEMFCPQQN